MESNNIKIPSNLSKKHFHYYQELQKGLEMLLEIYPLTPENKWNLCEKQKDFLYYSKNDKKNTGFNFSRGEVEIAKDPQEIIDYINDLSKKSEWDHLFESGKTVEILNDATYVSYQRFKPIFPVGARDFLMAIGNFPQSPDLHALVGVSVEDPSIPEEKNYTRANVHVYTIFL